MSKDRPKQSSAYIVDPERIDAARPTPPAGPSSNKEGNMSTEAAGAKIGEIIQQKAEQKQHQSQDVSQTMHLINQLKQPLYQSRGVYDSTVTDIIGALTGMCMEREQKIMLLNARNRYLLEHVKKLEKKTK